MEEYGADVPQEFQEINQKWKIEESNQEKREGQFFYFLSGKLH